MDAGGSGAHETLSGVSRNSYAAWSPDGDWLVVPGHEDEGGLWIVRPDGSDASLVAGTAALECSSPVWSPTDHGWPLFFRGQGLGQEGLWFVPGYEEWPVYFADYWGPVWSGDGTEVAFGVYGNSEEGHSSQVHLFRAEPDFWP
jgi:hypothetical protein